MRSKVVLFHTYSTENPTVVSVGGLAPLRNSSATCAGCTRYKPDSLML